MQAPDVGSSYFKVPNVSADSSEKSYAQAWALVHFLRHGDPSNRKIFKQMMDVLPAGLSRVKTLEKVLEGVDLAALERGFRGYISSLRQ